jgi:hypothetical protein
MIHTRKTETYIIDIYTCERCGYETEFKVNTAICPKHGEFCNECRNREESRFPLVICPECKITWEEAMKTAHVNGPNLQFYKMELPDPFIIIRDDSSGTWIGSKKNLKSRGSTIAKPGRIIKVYEE